MFGVEGERGSPGLRPGPPPAAVPGNLWTEIEPPRLGRLDTAPPVSIVVEGDDPAEAERTLEALSAQTYPESLIEPVRSTDSGGATPSGEVMIFIPAGAVPEPTLVEGHVRWHLSVSDAVTVGPLGPDDGLGLICDLTRGLTEHGPDLYRAAALGNIGLRRETHAAIGEGATERAELRRIDRAHRLACHGTVFVPELAAACTCRRAGELAAAVGLAPDAPGEAPPPGIRAEAAAVVPAPPFRAPASPRRFERPGVVVNLDATGASASELTGAIATMLGGRCGDLELRVQVDERHDEREAIEGEVAASGAVLAPASIHSFCASPIQVTIPGVVMPDPRTLADLCELMISERVGVIRVTIPGISPEEAIVEVYASGPLARARRVAAHIGEPLDHVLMRLFGERWISGVEVSIRPHGVEEAEVSEHGMLAAATDLEDERIKHLRYLRRADDAARQLAANERRLRRDRLRVRAERLRADRLEARAEAARQR